MGYLEQGPRPLRIEQPRLERARLWAEIAALLAAGCWGIHTFLYQTWIVPTHLPPREVISLDARRIAPLPSNYVGRVSVTLHNDGAVDTDTAALAESVYAASADAFSDLRSSASSTVINYGSPPNTWRVARSRGILFAGAVLGDGRTHLILRPGDSVTLQFVAVVPRRYTALRVTLETIFGRYPIEPRVAVKLVKNQSAIRLKADYISAAVENYFSV
jgi:hypothetical protein